WHSRTGQHQDHLGRPGSRLRPAGGDQGSGVASPLAPYGNPAGRRWNVVGATGWKWARTCEGERRRAGPLARWAARAATRRAHIVSVTDTLLQSGTNNA